MGVQKITFEGGNVTSKIDADLYHHLFSLDVGILQYLKNEIRYTLANNTITFSDGYISIYGRIIYVENQTTIGVIPDSSKSGYIVLGVNSQTNEVSIYKKEQSGGYPSLTTDNLSNVDGLYEFALCAYTKTTTSVTLNSYYVRDYVTINTKKVDDLSTEITEKYLPKERSLRKVSGGTYQISGTSSNELYRSIVYLTINSTTLITFPGDIIFDEVGSNRNITYRYGDSDFSLSLRYEGGVLTMTCGNAIHTITSAHFKQ